MSLPAKPQRNCKKCQALIPVSLIINEIKIYSQDRSYCYICSPYGSYKNKEHDRNLYPATTRVCRICERDLDVSEFHTSRIDGRIDLRYKNSYCKKCQAHKAKSSRQLFKMDCVKYKGGKCEVCGYDKCVAALEFHHRNKMDKEFQISRCSKYSLTEQIKAELDKCQIVCSNCHKEIHYSYNKGTQHETKPD